MENTYTAQGEPFGALPFCGLYLSLIHISYMLAYYAAILAGLLLVTYVPAVSLGLPSAAGMM